MSPRPETFDIQTATLKVTVSAPEGNLSKFKIMLFVKDSSGGSPVSASGVIVADPLENPPSAVVWPTVPLQTGWKYWVYIWVFDGHWGIHKQIELETFTKSREFHLKLHHKNG